MKHDALPCDAVSEGKIQNRDIQCLFRTRRCGIADSMNNVPQRWCCYDQCRVDSATYQVHTELTGEPVLSRLKQMMTLGQCDWILFWLGIREVALDEV
jgi:hypothetical protein